MGRRRLYDSDAARVAAYRNRKRNTRIVIPLDLMAAAGPLRTLARSVDPAAFALALVACDLVRCELLDWEAIRYAGYVPSERCKHGCRGL